MLVEINDTLKGSPVMLNFNFPRLKTFMILFPLTIS